VCQVRLQLELGWDCSLLKKLSKGTVEKSGSKAQQDGEVSSGSPYRV